MLVFAGFYSILTIYTCIFQENARDDAAFCVISMSSMVHFQLQH
jgi:hypothetical protein